MAKTKTSTYKFYIVDLIRNKPNTKYISIPKYRVDVNIEVTTKGIFSASDVPESVFKRLEKTAREALERYEDVIGDEAARIDKKIDLLVQKNAPAALAEAEALAQGMNASIRNALASAEGAAQAAIAARLAKEAQGDKNLKEARARTVLKWTMGVVAITTSIAKLVATSGGDVSSYVSIAKKLHELGKDLVQHLKKDEQLREDLVKAIQGYMKLRETSIMQAAERQQLTDFSGVDFGKPKEAIRKIYDKILAAGGEVAKGRDKKAVAKDFVDFAVKNITGGKGKAETARKAYREHTTKTRHKVDDLSSKAGELQQAMKAAKTLKDGVRIGAECMQMKRRVTGMAATLDEREKFLDEMQQLMAGNGLEIDDRTTLQKLAALDKMTILSQGGELYTSIKSVYDLIKEVKKAVA